MMKANITSWSQSSQVQSLPAEQRVLSKSHEVNLTAASWLHWGEEHLQQERFGFRNSVKCPQCYCGCQYLKLDCSKIAVWVTNLTYRDISHKNFLAQSPLTRFPRELSAISHGFLHQIKFSHWYGSIVITWGMKLWLHDNKQLHPLRRRTRCTWNFWKKSRRWALCQDFFFFPNSYF